MEQGVVKITCPGCEKVYRIPRDSLPEGKRVTVTCPSCKTRIKVVGAKQVDPVSSSISKDTSGGERAPEYFDAGSKVALVACRDPLALVQIEKELKVMGYEHRDMATAEELNDRFKFFTYPLVILSQKGPDMDVELRRMLEVLSKLSTGVRRETFVVYIHLGGNRFDTLQAFSMGVDLTLSPLDLSNLSSILDGEIAAKKEMLQPFFHVLNKVEGGITI